MKMRKTGCFLLAAVLVFSLVACGQEKEDTAPKKENMLQSGEDEKTADSKDTYTFEDSAGRKVEIPKKLERIAPMGTLAQIVIFALAPDSFAGLSSEWGDTVAPYLDKKYQDLPVFGQFYGSSDLNMEALAAANPQVLIDIGEKKEGAKEDLDGLQEQLGIPVISIEATTEGMPQCYETLGKLFGMEEKAKTLSDYCEKIYRRTVEGMRNVSEKKKVLYCLGDNGTNVIARDSFHSEILDLVADNCAVVEEPSSKGNGNEVTMEQIYLWNPEVILFAPDSVYDTVKDDTAWQQLEAIQDGEYFEVPIGPYNWMGFPPSVNRYMGMIWLCNLLYPEQFSYDMFEETKEFYQMFYHFQMETETYEKLLEHSKRNKNI